MLKQFAAVWLMYWAVVAALPVHSLYPSTLAAWLLQVVFVLLVASAYVGTMALLGARRGPSVMSVGVPNSLHMVRVAFLLSLLGLAALAYDKIVIQGIDYSDGVAVAREEWRRLGEEREGAASSPLSALGYLFGSAYYVAMVVALTQVRQLTARQRVWTLVGCFGFLIANSVLTGGRSNVLLLGAFALASFAARPGLRVTPGLRSWWQRTMLKVLVATALGYTVYIFYERAQAGGDVALVYAIDFLPFLGVEANAEWRSSLGDGALDTLQAMLVLALSYVSHSFATVAAIIDAAPEDKTIVFLHLTGILAKLGVVAVPDGDWFLAGRFPSLPGALLHQFGWFGFVLASLVLGIVCGALFAWTSRRPRSLLALGSATMAGVVMLLSPALFAADFLAFPFVAAAFVIVAMSCRRNRLRRRTLPPAGGMAGMDPPRRANA